MNNPAQLESHVQNIITEEVVVLRNVNHFPIYDQEFVSPNLVVGVNHSGTARALYDNHEVVFSANELAVVLPNHLVMPHSTSPNYNATLLVISNPFVQEFKLRSLSHDHYKYHLSPACVLSAAQVSLVMKIIDVIDEITKTPVSLLPKKHEMLLYKIDILSEMVSMFRIEQDREGPATSRNNKLFNDFCDLLARHYRESHEVNFYAGKLNLTPKYFSKVIYQTIGITAVQWIEQYVTSKAKHMLTTRKDMSIQQVAYHLGFNEQSSFCRFFKRITNMTPSQYIKEGAVSQA